MKLDPGYYVAYRTNGNGEQLRLLSRRFEHTDRGAETAKGWASFVQTEHHNKDVVVIQVLDFKS